MDSAAFNPFLDAVYNLWVGGNAPGKLRFRWEIHQQGVLQPVEISIERYPTMEKAHAAGLPIVGLWQRGERVAPAPCPARQPTIPLKIAPQTETPMIRKPSNEPP